MKNLFVLLFLLWGLTACQQPTSPLGVAADFYPPTEVLRSGIVNKYYLHYNSFNKYEQWTDIEYYLYELNRSGELEVTHYNAGYQPTSRSRSVFHSGRQLVLEHEQYWRQDSFPSELKEAVLRNWVIDTAHYQSNTVFDKRSTENLALQQLQVQDTLADNRHLKLFRLERQQTYAYADEEDRKHDAQITQAFAEGLGLYSSTLVLAEGTLEIDLIEQIPATEFRKHQAAAPKRVAYIDPAQTLDKGTDFAPCDAPIVDYYNGHPSAGPKGGKRALWNLLKPLDTDVLQGQSGYLTFRFVINCEGEAGYFITDEVDLDFVRKRFPVPLVQQVFRLLNECNNWQPARINGSAYDAYAYITLKLLDGELIELLP